MIVNGIAIGPAFSTKNCFYISELSQSFRVPAAPANEAQQTPRRADWDREPGGPGWFGAARNRPLGRPLVTERASCLSYLPASLELCILFYKLDLQLIEENTYFQT